MARRKRREGRDPVAVLSTSIEADDRLVGRGIGSVRETRVTARQSVRMPFAAPRIEMGEYN